MKSTSVSLGILITVAIIAIGVGTAAKDSLGQKEVAQEIEQENVDDPRFAWEFQVVQHEEAAAPATDVVLRVDGSVYEVGTYDGNCFAIEGSSWKYLDNEVTGVICWFASAGELVDCGLTSKTVPHSHSSAASNSSVSSS